MSDRMKQIQTPRFNNNNNNNDNDFAADMEEFKMKASNDDVDIVSDPDISNIYDDGQE